jgi:hypothetical protein
VTSLARTEQATAWELRAAWGTSQAVRLTLTERALIRTIVGQVSRVSVTGTFAVVDGWHVPIVDVLAVGKPTVADREAYAAELERHMAQQAAEEAALQPR